MRRAARDFAELTMHAPWLMHPDGQPGLGLPYLERRRWNLVFFFDG
jgi:hypothetical protein